MFIYDPTLEGKTRPKLIFAATYGVGDFMMALNIAYSLQHWSKQGLYLDIYWYHSEDHLHHFEEEETIIERFEYIRQFYLGKDRVQIKHWFNSNDHLDNIISAGGPIVLSEKFKKDKPNADNNLWSFRPSLLAVNPKKVCVWRPTFNADAARPWKQVLTKKQWDFVIDCLSMWGYEVVELCYRTPISEAHYHIATCNFTVSYDGMWHYIAKNYFKPMIVTSASNITKYHTPHALMMVDHDKNPELSILQMMTKLYTPMEAFDGLNLYQHIHQRASQHKKKFIKYYDRYDNANRPSSDRDKRRM